MKMINLLRAAAVVAASVVAGSANALTFNFAATVSGVNLSAEISFLLNSTNGNKYTYDVSVKNTTAPQPGDNSLTGFGMNVDPGDVVFVSENSSVFNFAGGSGQVNQELGSYEFCYEVDNNNNCLGNNPTNALGEGETNLFQMVFQSDISALTFLNAFVRFQEVGSQNKSAKIGNSVVPLPAAGWLLVGGIGSLAVLRRRRRA